MTADFRRRPRFVRIRICGIIGFSGLDWLVFGWQALIRIGLGWIFGYGEKRRLCESEILKIPPILKILILTKTRGLPRRLLNYQRLVGGKVG